MQFKCDSANWDKPMSDYRGLPGYTGVRNYTVFCRMRKNKVYLGNNLGLRHAQMAIFVAIRRIYL